jgi:hypothetical protein
LDGDEERYFSLTLRRDFEIITVYTTSVTSSYLSMLHLKQLLF